MALIRPVYNLDGSVVGEVELPEVFELEIRPDVIRRVYLYNLTSRIQPQGRDPLAGLRTSAESWGAGHGVARVPRVKGRGYSAAARGARVNQAVKGVRVKAPRSDKVILERVNKKERALGIASAIAASADIRLVAQRHRLNGLKAVPIVVVDDLSQVSKTKEIYNFLIELGLEDELLRAKRRFKKIRAGRGKMRGRVRKRARGPLLIFAERSCPAMLAARNIPGVDVCSIHYLSVSKLAPGGVPGRLTVWTKKALEELPDVLKLP